MSNEIVDEFGNELGSDFDVPDEIKNTSITIEIDDNEETSTPEEDIMDIDNVDMEGGFLLDEEHEDKIHNFYRVLSFYNSSSKESDLTRLHFESLLTLIKEQCPDFNDSINSFKITGDGTSSSNEAFNDFINNYIKYNKPLIDNFVGKMIHVLSNSIRVVMNLKPELLDHYKEVSYFLDSTNNCYMRKDATVLNAFKLEFNKLREIVLDDGYDTPQFNDMSDIIFELGYEDKTLDEIVKLIVITFETVIGFGVSEDGGSKLTNLLTNCQSIIDDSTPLTHQLITEVLFDRERMISLPSDIVKLDILLVKNNFFDLLDAGCVKVF